MLLQVHQTENARFQLFTLLVPSSPLHTWCHLHSTLLCCQTCHQVHFCTHLFMPSTTKLHCQGLQHHSTTHLEILKGVCTVKSPPHKNPHSDISNQLAIMDNTPCNMTSAMKTQNLIYKVPIPLPVDQVTEACSCVISAIQQEAVLGDIAFLVLVYISK